MLPKFKTAPLRNILNGTIPDRTIKLPENWRKFVWFKIIFMTFTLATYIGLGLATLIFVSYQLSGIAIVENFPDFVEKHDLIALDQKILNTGIPVVLITCLIFGYYISIKYIKNDLINFLQLSESKIESFYSYPIFGGDKRGVIFSIFTVAIYLNFIAVKVTGLAEEINIKVFSICVALPLVIAYFSALTWIRSITSIHAGLSYKELPTLNFESPKNKSNQLGA